jgi:2-C-methyl-D-erythritol 4-phosphate cytidylyltransferase
MKKIKNIALISAAGSGIRFGSKTPKQYVSLKGNALLKHVIEKFIASNLIDKIVISINKKHINLYKKALDKIKTDKILPLISLGDDVNTYQKSVRNSLNKIKTYNPKNIVLCSSSRPFIHTSDIKMCVKSLTKYKGCIIGFPVQYPIKVISKKNEIIKGLNRDSLFQAWAPVAYDFETLLYLHNKYKNRKVVDDATLFELDNIPIKVIKSFSKNNIKITYKEDFLYADYLMSK